VLLEESDLQPQYLDDSIRQLQTKKIGYGKIFFLTYVSKLLEGSIRIMIPVIIVSMIFL
jgi:hypothetical protein